MHSKRDAEVSVMFGPNMGFAALHIAQVLATRDVLYLADDDPQAETLAACLEAMLPGQTIRIASSDTLPGDRTPASPANAGQRMAALRALRLAQMSADRPRLACILSGEAAAQRYPEPSAFDDPLPTVCVGDRFDIERFAETVEALGYVTDEQVDEPGETAIRGEVVDIFPANAVLPVRIERAEQKVGAIRSYDPVSQRTIAELDRIEVGRANEPALGDGSAILAHLTPGLIGSSPKADRRRARTIQLAREAAGPADGAIDAIDEASWTKAIAAWQPLAMEGECSPVPRFAQDRAPLAALARFVRPLLAQGRRLVLAGSARDIRFLRGKIARRLSIQMVEASAWSALMALPADVGACLVMPADAGFVDERSVLIAAADLLGSRALVDAAPAVIRETWVGGSADIRIGDVIVHEDHGVGRVLGLEQSPLAHDESSEMIALEYAGGNRRLVAIDDADRIWRYGADADAVTLDRLDGSSWHKRRGTVDAAIAETAKRLAALAEARDKLTAPIMAPDAAAYERFVGLFPFNETADQARAIGAVRDDLASGKPMDRLVIGDVGYGKTEVALRAAALVALAGYQVVIAAPTTVLVRQHLDTFRRRFADTGIAVAGLSRLSSAAEKKTVKAAIADGSVQIAIGTGAVMGKGLSYAKLGLVVIDEEQRFGAADKLRLRGSGEVHLLTLSATPIPRSLQMALVGLQQLSVIATPPARRQPIRTVLEHFDDSRVRTALLREKSRGGQSFVVVPRIEDMADLAERLARIVPDLVLVSAHGKMPSAQIDEVMVDFAQGRGDILLATNIIEAGLDVPRANTMIVWHADRFGLAQLHQLRGRVGRGNRRGQVLLLTGDEGIADHTLKRLRTLATFDQLGAGFAISAQDLDMRGAGDLLGEDQTGHAKLIGIDLYQHLLACALRAARGETVERWTPELHLGSAGNLPETWIPEPDIRLGLYVRMARLEDEAALDAFAEELVDRFGPLPPEAEALIAHARIRMAARRLRIERIDAGPAAIALTPRRDFAADLANTGLTESNGRLLLSERTADEERIERVSAVLEALA